MSVTCNLAEIRKRDGLTQKQISDATGISMTAIYYYEAGQRTPSVENALKISEAIGFGVFVEDIWSLNNE